MAIGVSVNTLDRMVLEGVVPPPRRYRNRKIYLVYELETAIAELPCNREVGEGADDEDWTASA